MGATRCTIQRIATHKAAHLSRVLLHATYSHHAYYIILPPLILWLDLLRTHIQSLLLLGPGQAPEDLLEATSHDCVLAQSLNDHLDDYLYLHAHFNGIGNAQFYGDAQRLDARTEVRSRYTGYCLDLPCHNFCVHIYRFTSFLFRVRLLSRTQ